MSLGPLFILALLWQPTARFFELWAGQVLKVSLNGPVRKPTSSCRRSISA
nr:type IV secretion system protein [Chelativorans sp. Marseille-P2723]